MDIHVTNNTDKSREVVYVVNARLLFSKHRVSKIVSSVGWRAAQAEKNVACCAVM